MMFSLIFLAICIVGFIVATIELGSLWVEDNTKPKVKVIPEALLREIHGEAFWPCPICVVEKSKVDRLLDRLDEPAKITQSGLRLDVKLTKMGVASRNEVFNYLPPPPPVVEHSCLRGDNGRCIYCHGWVRCIHVYALGSDRCVICGKRVY